MKILLLAILLCGSSCFALEKNFTYSCPDELSAEVCSSIDCWNNALGGMFHATRVSSNMSPDIAVTYVKEGEIGKYRGLTDKHKGHITIQIVQNCKHEPSVVLHEFGHAFGLGHSKKLTSIMYHSAKDDATLSVEDEERIRHEWRK